MTKRYWDDDTRTFIDVEVVWSGREELIDGRGWRMRDCAYASGPNKEDPHDAPKRPKRPETKRGPMSNEQIIQATELAEQGKSARAIALRIGATLGQVRGWAIRSGRDIRVYTITPKERCKKCLRLFKVQPQAYAAGCRTCPSCLERANGRAA